MKRYLLALALVGAISWYGAFCGPTRTSDELACREAVRSVVREHERWELGVTEGDELAEAELWAARDCGR